MIDGSLGMAYGVSCRTFLRTVAGVPSAVASAVIHIAEIPSSFFSGLSHLRIGNVNRDLLVRLMIPGIIGGVLGAWLLVDFGNKLERIIDVYLIIMGVLILQRAIRGEWKRTGIGKFAYPVGFMGGFLDAVGGGGWGPLATSAMIASGEDVKKSIGTVNAAEFLVTIAETTAFVAMMNDLFDYTEMILGLVIGGVIAAPIAARVCSRLPERPLMAAVGILIIGLNIYNLIAWK